MTTKARAHVDASFFLTFFLFAGGILCTVLVVLFCRGCHSGQERRASFLESGPPRAELVVLAPALLLWLRNVRQFVQHGERLQVVNSVVSRKIVTERRRGLDRPTAYFSADTTA